MAMQNSTVIKIVLTAAVAVGGVVFFVKSGIGSTQEYMMVDELLAGGDLSRYEGREMKVHGWVVAGTIKEKVIDQQTIRTFVIHKAGKKIRVFSRGPKPDTFQDQSEVVATGRIVPVANIKAIAAQLETKLDVEMAHVVEATDLQAKCPSKYDGAQVNKNLKYE
jgi:cytochrome c-type biogenesis protein CcmE